MSEIKNDATLALKLRQAGVAYKAIAEKLGYPNQEAARDAVIDELERVTRDADAVSAQINIQQLDSLLLSLWRDAREGNQRSVDQVLRILDRRERLEERVRGLAPARKEEVEEDEDKDEDAEDAAPRHKAAFGGGTNIPGSTQLGDVRPTEVRRAISKAQMGNMNAWKTGSRGEYIPSLYCNTCRAKSTCVHYTENSVCLVPEEFQELVEIFGDGDPQSVMAVLKQKIIYDLERLAIGRRGEYATGGKLSREVTALSNRVEKSLKLLMALYGRHDEVGGRRVLNITQQNLYVGGEVSQTVVALLRLPTAKRMELLDKWEGSLVAQREILEEAGVDLSGLRGFGGVASSGQVLAKLRDAMSSPPGVDGRPPGSVEGRGSRVVDAEWELVNDD